MRATNILFIVLLFSAISLRAQIVKTFAGNGGTVNSGDGGPATAAGINFPIAGVFDKNGNFYFATSDVGCSIRKISIDGVITTVAGGSCGYGGDGGSATLAKLYTPQGVAIDTSGNIYIADNGNNRIRKVDAASGIITTVAGNGAMGFAGDGEMATTASLNDPLDVCFDKFGNLLIADADNFRVRMVNRLGIITTVAGNGMLGIAGEGGPATNASLMPEAVCSDKYGNIYIADDNGDETRVLRIDATSNIIRVAGDPTHHSYNGDNIAATSAYIAPVKIAVDDYDNLFIADEPNSRIRMVNSAGIIYTVVGNGITGYSGDTGSATSIDLNYPAGIALDACGNLYVSDSRNYRIRKVTFPHCNYLAVENQAMNDNRLIFPNPTYDVLNINGVKINSDYSLLTIVGEKIQYGRLGVGDNSITIQCLPNGIYLLAITDDEGKRTVTRIIKQ